MQKTPSLLEVRNYMFARQSQLLLVLNKPWEVSYIIIFYNYALYFVYKKWFKLLKDLKINFFG